MKGPKVTSWIWYLHSSAHDFDIQTGSASQIARKVFSSGLAHLSLVFLWFGFLYLQGAYYSNYIDWLKDPSIHPSAHIVSILIGQDILNSDALSPRPLSKVSTVTSGLLMASPRHHNNISNETTSSSSSIRNTSHTLSISSYLQPQVPIQVSVSLVLSAVQMSIHSSFYSILWFGIY